MAQIQPLHDRVLIKRSESEQKTAAGIIIPDTAQEKTQLGTVIAAGEGKILSDGKTKPMSVEKGNTVLFGKFSGTEIKFNGEEFLILREDEILGVVTN